MILFRLIIVALGLYAAYYLIDRLPWFSQILINVADTQITYGGFFFTTLIGAGIKMLRSEN